MPGARMSSMAPRRRLCGLMSGGPKSMQMNKGLGAAVVQALRRETTVLPFHADWIKATFEPDVQISALSCPRGSAKTWIAGRLAALCITPGSPLFQEGIECLSVSASLEQSRILLGFVREALGDREDDYRWLDSSQRLTVTHKKSRTRLRILSSSGKRAMGLAQFSTIFADEPGAWEVRGGALMWDALRQSLGKRPGQRLVLIGTRAPAEIGNWWPGLIDGGSGKGTHVTELSAPVAALWDAWATIRTVNPLVGVNPDLKKTILRGRDDARRDELQRPAFKAFRLNQSVEVYRSALIEAEKWRRVEARPVPEREGRAIVGIDLGATRSWSAAWCIWPNGRSETYAVCPGIPNLAAREKSDNQPAGLYRRLHEQGVLITDEGLRVSRPATLIDHLVEIGVAVDTIYCDRFALGTFRDVVAGRWPIVDRVARWSSATEDIAGFRKLVADGPLSIAPHCRDLARAGLGQAVVATDDQGSVRLQKRRYNASRDDVPAAGVLACGALARALTRGPIQRVRYLGAA